MNAPEKVALTSTGMSTDTAKFYTNMPSPPKFDNLADERLHRKQRLAAAFRIFSRFGLDEGAAGHITVRDPEFPETFWLNPFGVHFSQVKVSNLIRVDHEGNLVEGGHPVNRAAFALDAARRSDGQAGTRVSRSGRLNLPVRTLEGDMPAQ